MSFLVWKRQFDRQQTLLSALHVSFPTNFLLGRFFPSKRQTDVCDKAALQRRVVVRGTEAGCDVDKSPDPSRPCGDQDLLWLIGRATGVEVTSVRLAHALIGRCHNGGGDGWFAIKVAFKTFKVIWLSRVSFKWFVRELREQLRQAGQIYVSIVGGWRCFFICCCLMASLSRLCGW